jgi:hypothetical protein
MSDISDNVTIVEMADPKHTVNTYTPVAAEATLVLWRLRWICHITLNYYLIFTPFLFMAFQGRVRIKNNVSTHVMRSTQKRYYINTICLEHVQRGVQGGFTQAGHGSNVGLKKLAKGDVMIFYSPRVAMARSASPLQEFTAIGHVTDDAPYQFVAKLEDGRDINPWRRKLDFYHATNTPIKPMLHDLTLTRHRGNKWGMAFRRGLFEIDQTDARLIAHQMKVEL